MASTYLLSSLNLMMNLNKHLLLLDIIGMVNLNNERIYGCVYFFITDQLKGHNFLSVIYIFIILNDD